MLPAPSPEARTPDEKQDGRDKVSSEDTSGCRVDRSIRASGQVPLVWTTTSYNRRASVRSCGRECGMLAVKLNLQGAAEEELDHPGMHALT